MAADAPHRYLRAPLRLFILAGTMVLMIPAERSGAQETAAPIGDDVLRSIPNVFRMDKAPEEEKEKSEGLNEQSVRFFTNVGFGLRF